MRAPALRLALFMFFLGILIFGASTPVQALPSQHALTPEEYWQLVDHTISTLRGLRTQPEEVANQRLEVLARSWARPNAINYLGGETSPLDTSFIVAQLRLRPSNLDTLIRIFTDLQNARIVNPSRRFGAVELAALKPILELPEFQWNRQPTPLEAWWAELQEKFWQWFDDLFGRNEISVPVAGDLFTLLAVIILALILLYVFRKLFGDFIADASMDQEQMAGDELLTAESALQKAKDISKAGDYRTAVRYLYLSSLLTLDERGLLRFDRSKTNREYLRTVAALPQLSAPLRDVIDVFDRVWYGFQPLDETSFQHYVEKVDQLREQKK